MGVLFDYFSAASDEVAASTIDLVGGPGAPLAGSLQPGMANVHQTGASGGAPFDTVDAKGIDPAVQLWTLEALLTSRDYDQIAAGPRAGKALVIRDEGEGVVVTLTDELQDALAAADDAQLASVAVPWSQTEEFWGQDDPQMLAELLHELAELARRARSRDERLYCWICV
jgi:hypothetical protein